VESDNMKGSIGDIIYFDGTAHDDITRNIVERYLMNKYSNSITPPLSILVTYTKFFTIYDITTVSNFAGFVAKYSPTLSPIHDKTITEITMYFKTTNQSYSSVTLALYYSNTAGSLGTEFGRTSVAVSPNLSNKPLTFTNTNGLYIPNTGDHYFYLKIINIVGNTNDSWAVIKLQLGTTAFPTSMNGTDISTGDLRTYAMPQVIIKGY
jgi:hypothetical protein